MAASAAPISTRSKRQLDDLELSPAKALKSEDPAIADIAAKSLETARIAMSQAQYGNLGAMITQYQTNPTQATAYFDLEAIRKGKEHLSKGRNYLRYQGKSIAVARALWNFWHPNDPLCSTDVVLYKNNNTKDETLENLIKVSASKHALMCLQAQKQKRKQSRATSV